MTWQAWVVLAVLLICLTLLFLELFPPYVVLLCGLCLVWSLNIISTRDAIRGFSNDALITVGALFIVVKGVDRAKVIDFSVCQCLGEHSSEQMALLRFCALVFVFGGVMNNTPLVALLMPVIRDWCRQREFAPSKFLMPLAYASMGGGQMTIIGSSTNLMVAGMLEAESGERFTFFDPARVGALVNVMAMGYLLLVGVRMLPERGGLFLTLKGKKDDMVTQLQVLATCPLVGSDLREAMEQLLIPREAVLKIFRQPPRRKLQPASSRTESSLEASREAVLPAGDGGLARQQGPLPGRKRASTDWLPQTYSLMEGPPPLPSIDVGRAGETPELLPIGHPSVREIFPVPEFEVVEAGDVLVLSLPQEKCMALTESEHVATLFDSLIAGVSDANVDEEQRERKAREAARSLRICNLDLLDVPGRENEFVEVVVSQHNPFLGESFTSGGARHRFEEAYQVAVLATRRARRGGIGSMIKKPDAPDAEADQLTSLGNRRGSRLMEATRVRTRARGSTWGGEEPPKATLHPIKEGSLDEKDPNTLQRSSLADPLQARRDESEVEQERQARRDEPEPEREQRLLMPGDMVLVLAKSGEAMEKLKLSEDFLVVTQVAHSVEAPRKISDHVPGALFLTALVLVATGVFPMVKVSLVLAAVYMVFGWVDPSKLRENVDWGMLALIGCSLGLAAAVQQSGLSSSAAQLFRRASFGVRGTVFFLFFFTMMISELVTSNGAAALGFPLAVDLSRQLGLKSLKPLAMVVVLAANVSFMNPVSSAATLMTMGPGGYRFVDFLKVGLGMDLIYWLGCSLLMPVMWDMEQYSIPILPD